MKLLRSSLAIFALAALLTAILIGSHPSQAVGKGKPSTNGPTGEIYIQIEDNLAVMNPDGTGKVLLSANVPTSSEPSYGVYNGNRWFVAATDVPGQALPDGQQRKILELVREDGQARTTILDDPTMWLNWDFAWSKDDAWISVAGYRWDLTTSPPEVVEAGLYIMPIEFDSDGPFAPVGPTLVAEGDVHVDVNLVPTILRHDWSPDSSGIVFQRYNVAERSREIYTADLTTGNVSLLALNASDPDWSPDGSRIAFVSSVQTGGGGKGRIETIAPDDSNESTRNTLVEINTLKGWTTRWLTRPRWSPTGRYLAYEFTEWGGGDFSHNVYRVTDDGRNPVNLTEDTTLWASLVDWR